MPPGLDFVVLVAGRGDEGVRFSPSGGGTRVAGGALPRVGEDAPSLSGVLGVELVCPVTSVLAQGFLEGVGEGVRHVRRESPRPVARCSWPAPAGTALALAFAKQGKDAVTRLGGGGGVGGPGAPPSRSDP